jgi:hypothetical protein
VPRITNNLFINMWSNNYVNCDNDFNASVIVKKNYDISLQEITHLPLIIFQEHICLQGPN